MAKKKKDDDARTEDTPQAEIDAAAHGAGANEQIEAVSDTASGQQPPQQQVQLQVDDSQANTAYSSTARVWGSGEEIFLDFSQGLKPAGKNKVRLKIDHRVVMNPWAAKRLAMTLGQTIARYEQPSGTLELDEQRRRNGGAS